MVGNVQLVVTSATITYNRYCRILQILQKSVILIETLSLHRKLCYVGLSLSLNYFELKMCVSKKHGM